MEDATNKLNNTSVSLIPGLNLIGNPLMTHLSFSNLYSHNSGVIINKVKFWNGTTFVSFISGPNLLSSPSSDGNIIPPMQSFFVQSNSGGTLNLNIATDFIANNTVKLRSLKINPELYVTASNINGSSSMLICLGDSSDYSFKLFSQYTTIPEVYCTKDSIPVDINVLDSLPTAIPLFIKSTYTGLVTFTFQGSSSFNNYNLFLVNSETGDRISLQEGSSYTFNFDNSQGILFLEFDRINTENKNSVNNSLNIRESNNSLTLISDKDNIIHEVIICDVTGKIILNYSNNSYICNIPYIQQGCYILKVLMDNNCLVKKIFIK